MISFKMICAGKVFSIPANQRAFSWGESQVTDLISDLKLAGTQSHYLGTVIVSRAVGTPDFQDQNQVTTALFTVEDGQQRLTTLFIFANEIRKQMNFRQIHSLQASELDDFVFLNHHGKSPRLRNEQSNLSQYFSYILSGQPAPPADRVAGMNSLDTVKAYLENFVRLLSDLELLTWMQTLANRALLVWVDLAEPGSNLNRYLTFDAINSRGLSLTEFDKIKNFCILIGSLRGNPLAQTVSTSWFNALLELEKFSVNTRANEQDFIAELYSSHHNKQIGHGDVHDDFVQRYRPLLNNSDPVLEAELNHFIALWQPYARSFGFLVNRRRRNYYGSMCTIGAGNWLDRLDNLDLLTITRPLLVASHLKFNQNDFELASKYCEVYTFRVHGVLRRRKDANSGKIIGAANAMLRGASTISDFHSAMCDWLAAYGPLVAVLQELVDGKPKYAFDPNMPGWSSCYYFLYEYELSVSPQGVQPLPYASNRELSKNQQEHILPQSHRDGAWWEAEWPDASQADKAKHRLGNLVLTTNNLALGRRQIAEKLSRIPPDYCFEHQNATNSEKRVKNFTNGSEWKLDNILKREIELLTFAAERWGLDCSQADSGSVQLNPEFVSIGVSTMPLNTPLAEQESTELNAIADDELNDPS